MANTKEVAMLFDSSHCTGCKGCQVACKQWNMLPSALGLNENKFSGSYQNPPDLNGDTRLVMTFDEKESGNKYQPINFAIGRRSCFHCTDAACVAICSSGALYKNENGVVSYDTKSATAAPIASLLARSMCLASVRATVRSTSAHFALTVLKRVVCQRA